jgi:hypothetical protein
MFEFLRTLVSGDGSKSKGIHAELNQKKSNPINEIQLLEGHSDIVRIIIKVG